MGNGGEALSIKPVGRTAIKKILYIDYLDNISLVVGLVLKPFFNKVVYHNAKGLFQSKKSRFNLERIGVRWASYHGVPVEIFTQSLDVNIELGEAVLKKRFTGNRVYGRLIKYLKLDDVGVKKANISLIRLLETESEFEGAPSLALINYLYSERDYEVYYVPKTMINYLLALEYRRKITPVSFHIFFSAFWKISSRMIDKIYQRLKDYKHKPLKNNRDAGRSNDVKSDYGKYEIAFVPHKGLKYGEFFRKTYLYENNSDSIFDRKNLLTLSFEDSDPVSKRYYGFNKIPYDNINSNIGLKDILNNTFQFIKHLNVCSGVLKCFSLTEIISSLVVMEFFYKVDYFRYQLGKYSSLKVIYFHYDICVTNAFVLACHLRSIKTVSAQERTISFVYTLGLIFDHFLLVGEGFKSKVIESRFMDAFSHA